MTHDENTHAIEHHGVGASRRVELLHSHGPGSGDMKRTFTFTRMAAGIAVAAWLAGCTALSRDGKLGADAPTAQRPRPDATLGATARPTEALSAKPLDIDDAVRIALRNNRGEAADATQAITAQTRRAYIEAVAAEQASAYARQVQDSAQAGTQLATRMRVAGHFSKLDEAREQAFHAQAIVQFDKARQQAVEARGTLTRTMGLSGEQARYSLPDHLPDLPKDRPDPKDLERVAVTHRLAATTLDASAQSKLRESLSAYVTRYDIAKRYRDEIVPLRKTISDELLLRYNGMLASVFDLLADSREQAAAVQRYLDASKDFWLAHTNLEAALGVQLPSSDSPTHSKGQ